MLVKTDCPPTVNGKIVVELLKEPEILSSSLILFVVDALKLIHTVPFHWYENPEVLSV
jgi:hypothetical protein